VRSRYVGKSGSIAVYVSPVNDLSTREKATAFATQSERLSQEPGVKGVAGIPIIVYRMIEMIRTGFRQAALLALVSVMLVVFADFGRMRPTLVSLAPMVAGSIWMAGLVPVAGMTWNPLNSLGIPVILGVGIAFGVNLLHRLQKEPDRSIAVAGTGRAIVYSAATAMAGFGSLGLAAHRGLGSFGVALALGVAATMVSALVLVPALHGPAGGEDGTGTVTGP
jgi:predicted RND superfamily exporter protein